MRGLTAAGIVATMALPVLLPGGYWWGPLWLGLLGLLALLGRLVPGWMRVRPLGRRGWGLALMLLLFGASQLAIAAYHGEAAQLLPLLLPVVLALLVLPALHAWLPSLIWLWAGLALAGMTTGGWALWQTLNGVSRASGHEPLHAILFGNLSLLAGVLCLAGIGWALNAPRRYGWLVVLGLGALGGVAASVLSGTRGGWVALPLILLVFQRGYGRWLPRRQAALWWVGAGGLLAGLYVLPQTGVQHRVSLAVAEVEHYLAGERAKTGSVTTRLEMWQGAVGLIVERPLMGHGKAGYMEGMRSRVEAGELDRAVLAHAHAHNDLLNAWAKRGLPGLLALLGLYLLPLWLFRGGLNHPDTSHRALAVAGLLLPVTFLDFGLTYSFLAYPVGVAVYSGWLVVLWSLYRHAPLGRHPQ
ncbi:O-antigen ligase family protein [Halomonas sp. ATCH28]|uniref:O-antigen ligase family protein n=1 Tax=Halomonas gemina TaxID=2945105 RepID=A0ABT0SYR5_9GAMM|nr:O-antigen ligase family protein [Halomonas gemina]MCL7939426.1 O-antigen ligase family protein [Halomonas gemina]